MTDEANVHVYSMVDQMIEGILKPSPKSFKYLYYMRVNRESLIIQILMQVINGF